MIGPDATVTLDFAINRMASVVEKLLIYPDQMQANLDKLGGLVHSQRVLLALTQAGISREDARAMIEAGATRLGASASIGIVQEAKSTSMSA